MEEQIEKYINSENIPTKFIFRRLIRESKDFSERFESLFVKYNDNKYEVYLKDKLYKKNNDYCFILDEYYPFKPLQLLVNNIEYKKFLFDNTNNIKYREIFIKIFGNICLCCDNILSNKRWSPAITFIKIIDELDIFRTYKKGIIYKIITDKIKNKYLINDIDLECWLI
jgi:hypothetical protein